MNVIEREIAARGSDSAAVFVFPSDVAASLWLREALDITGAETVAANRFIAWDRFKEQSISETVTGKKPASAVVRLLYAHNLAMRNQSGEPLLRSLITPEYASGGQAFAGWLAGILPQLGLWKRKADSSPRARSEFPGRAELEDRDLAFLYQDWAAFMEAHQLFEPSWMRPPFKDTGKHYTIFFPEAMEDFCEYADLLSGSPHVSIVHCPPAATSQPLTLFNNAREEYRDTVLRIEALLRDGVLPAQIAVSVPELETAAPYLRREFELRTIPYEYRAGKYLSDYPAGRLFSLINAAVAGNFAFRNMKDLLLDRLIPWKNLETASALVDFGIRNHCVTAWEENGKLFDIWEEAFKEPSDRQAADRDLSSWYRKLKYSLTALTGAESFAAIRTQYFKFREEFLNMENLAPEDDAVLSRCVKELLALADLESLYPDCRSESPYRFFTDSLTRTAYVAQRSSGGVSIFPYRVAAGTPFPYQFILDASQAAATVLYSQLKFLRQDRREAIDAREEDASAAFFSLYSSAPRALSGTPPDATAHPAATTQTESGTATVRFSCALRNFSGYRTAHGFFALTCPPAPAENDPFESERLWLARNSEPGQSPVFPPVLYPLQKESFQQYAQRPGRLPSYLDTVFSGRVPLLTRKILERKMEETAVRVSQTDLVSFAACPARWFLRHVIGLEPVETDASLFDDRNLGLVYHKILEQLYRRISKTGDGAFKAEDIPRYREWTVELSAEITAAQAEFKGPLARPILQTIANRLADGISAVLELDGKHLNGYIPLSAESFIKLTRDGICYIGSVDRISVDPTDNTPVLIDYKSGQNPKVSDYRMEGRETPVDFQMTMYTFLAENAPESPCAGTKLENAFFLSLKDKKLVPIMMEKERFPAISGRSPYFSRTEFEAAMTAFQETARQFAAAVRAEDFRKPENLPRGTCLNCPSRGICRTVYQVQ